MSSEEGTEGSSVDEIRQLRCAVRAFIRECRDDGLFVPRVDCWMASYSPDFSKRMGTRGFIGVTWPKQYGGRALSIYHRYVITEELLAAGAPVMAHWIADRQSGPLLLKHGSERLKQEILPRIAAGDCYFAIGLSEPDAGSDLAAASTRARKVDQGWVIDGQKLWSTGAQNSQYMIALVRTSPPNNRQRHAGFSQLLIYLRAPGVTVKPIADMTGDNHFNEVHFYEVFVPDDCLVGNEGEGWAQVTGELALERSGPERFLSTFVLLEEAWRQARSTIDNHRAALFGRLLARTRSLRLMSLGVTRALSEERNAEVAAASIKDLGTRFEGEVIEQIRSLYPVGARSDESTPLQSMLASGLLHMPSFTLRGGTNEVLKGIVCRGLGLR